MNYAMIDENNIVFNIAVWDGETQWNPGCVLLKVEDEMECHIGWVVQYDDEEYSFHAPESEE